MEAYCLILMHPSNLVQILGGAVLYVQGLGLNNGMECISWRICFGCSPLSALALPGLTYIYDFVGFKIVIRLSWTICI